MQYRSKLVIEYLRFWNFKELQDSKGYQELKKIFEENDMAAMAQYILRDRLFEIHQKNFKEVSDQITYEGIGEAFEGDLLPYAGEWFADAIITAEK